MRIRNALVLCSLLLGFQASGFAHDFWLEPGQYIFKESASVPVQFKIGHKDSADNWNLRWDKIVALRLYTPSGVADMAASIVPKTNLLPGFAKSEKLATGTYIIGLESYHSLSELESAKFNDYVKEEGLKEILEYREANGLMQHPGIELYSRKAKTIVQVGDELSESVTKPIGHTLEIVPQQHPLKLGNKGALAVKVLFKGKPLQHALIEAAPLAKAKHKEQSTRTDNQGIATFNFSQSGPVMLNVIWGVPLTNNGQADFETYFSSLTFEVNNSDL
ncbi:DUF4198 domain-containing protein [Alteromonas ponticola]|uniref:DUF4198 domain-containing protein n=1 Tax=Alteromonas ponticola TaxID=2720613 RepID=A0ABX1R6J4_9ALTE|nr:DUF4198 domain-containing protein [Alteromonas ponticola]NMH61541.1 DUF4198 domain-containing protein [Alteromonas ponticola]